MERFRHFNADGMFKFLFKQQIYFPCKISNISLSIGYTKGTFHAKMGSIKDRNGRDLTEAEDIKTRWQAIISSCISRIVVIV